MTAKVNLKKYLAIDGKWQFVPVLKANSKPEPSVVLISGKPTTGISGTFYIEWRAHGKRIQQGFGTGVREAKDAWVTKLKELESPRSAGAGNAPPPIEHMSIKEACDNYLTGIRATKTPGKSKDAGPGIAFAGGRVEFASE
jgi:hypothetical protein